MKISKKTYRHLIEAKHLTPYIAGTWLDFRKGAGYTMSFVEHQNLTCNMTMNEGKRVLEVS